MNRWAKVEALLDREVQRETKRIIAKAKAAMGLGNGNGHSKPITTKRLNRAIRRTDKAVAKAYNAESPIVASFKNKAKKFPRGNPSRARQLHGRYLGLTRALTPTNKLAVKMIRAKEGVRAAIREAKRLRASA